VDTILCATGMLLIVFMFSIYFLSFDYCWHIDISCESPAQ
jgi:hypothetical protein